MGTWTSPGEAGEGSGIARGPGCRPRSPDLPAPAPRYLLSHGADIAAVNSDGDLPLDLAESDAMEGLLKAEIAYRGGRLVLSAGTGSRLQASEAGPAVSWGSRTLSAPGSLPVRWEYGDLSLGCLEHRAIV